MDEYGKRGMLPTLRVADIWRMVGMGAIKTAMAAIGAIFPLSETNAAIIVTGSCSMSMDDIGYCVVHVLVHVHGPQIPLRLVDLSLIAQIVKRPKSPHRLG